jgi:L-2-hydroxyglutarate oxidase
MDTADFLVLGGGIVGVTTALEARRRHPGSRVVLLEKEPELAAHSSGRNSGVLHAGLYYTPGSLKARFTRAGNERLTAYCRERSLPIRECGKLILAFGDREQAELDELLRRGRANGVPLEEVDEAEARRLEPAARVVDRALFSPTTAAVDPVAVTRSLADDARSAGVEIRAGEAFVDRENGTVRTTAGRWSPGYVVNAAGVHADRIAWRFGFGRSHRIIPFKGRYVRSRAGIGVRRHVYPVPDLRYPFLGVHLTVAVDGSVWIGPSASPALGREQYRLRDLRPGEALSGARSLLPLLAVPANAGLRRLAVREMKGHSRRALIAQASRLVRDLPASGRWVRGRPGIRAQLVDTRTWKLEDDFVYEADDRSCHVLNAVSPGFTCSLPLAEHLVDIMEGIRTQ